MGPGEVFWHVLWTHCRTALDPLHCVHKNTPGALKRCCCSVETQKRIKEFSKWKKPHQTWKKHSQINKSSPCLLYCCRTSPFVQQSLAAPISRGSVLIPAEVWQLFSSFLAAPALPVLDFLGAGSDAQQGNSFILGKNRALWLVGCPWTRITGQDTTPLQPNTCNHEKCPQISYHPN